MSRISQAGFMNSAGCSKIFGNLRQLGVVYFVPSSFTKMDFQNFILGFSRGLIRTGFARLSLKSMLHFVHVDEDARHHTDHADQSG
jgi:hypothetical protein